MELGAERSACGKVAVAKFWKRGCRNMPTVPKTQTKTKIHRKRRSITMATYFQSSVTWAEGTGKAGAPVTGCRTSVTQA